MTIWKSAARISHANLGGVGSNSWHARTDNAGGVGDGADLQDLTDMISTFYGSIVSVLSGGTNVAHDGIWTSVDEDEASFVNVTGFSVTVTGTSLTLPPQDCIVAGWRTSSPTKGGRGRTFLGPLDVDVLDSNGTIKTADLTTVQAAADALVESSLDTDANGALGVYSRAGVGNPADPGILRDFTSALVHDKFAVLRSRRD